MDIKKLKDFYKNKRVFVTGHTGFKGTWLCLILNYLGANVIGYSLKQTLYDNFYFYKAINLKKKIKSYYGDILNKNKFQIIFLTKLINLLYCGSFTDVATNHKLIKKEVLNKLNLVSKGFTLDFEISLKHDKYKFRYGLIHQDYL